MKMYKRLISHITLCPQNCMKKVPSPVTCSKSGKNYLRSQITITNSHLLILVPSVCKEASQVALVVKNPPANAQGIRDASLIPGWEDPLQKAIATHASILAWRIPWTEEPGGLESIGSQRVRYDRSDLTHT